jgi:hypothetical protein
LSDDNVVRFRKPPPPKKPRRPLRVSPWVALILGALAIGAVTFALDQQQSTNTPPAATP